MSQSTKLVRVESDASLAQDKIRSLVQSAQSALKSVQNKTCAGREWLQWFDYPQTEGFALAKKINSFVEKFPIHFDLVVVLGIGGSYLGTRAIYDGLTHEFRIGYRTTGFKQLPIVFGGQHLSESSLADLVDLLDQFNPVVNVISKTGTTIETSSAFRVIRSYMEKRYTKDASKRIIATTDADSGALRKIAGENHFASFEVPKEMGGRFSVFSAVGLLPLRLAGFDVDQLLKGGDAFFRELDDAAHPVFEYVAFRNACLQNGKSTEVFAFAEPKLRNFIEWLKQLFGESEGKNGKGIFPTGFAMTTDLHSLGQYMQDGQRIVFETFLRFERGDAKNIKIPKRDDDIDGLGYLAGRSLDEINKIAEDATMAAHREGKVPVMRLNFPKLDLFGIGYAIAFFETACALSASILGVNAFDQPGVEAYKKKMRELLKKRI